MSNSVDLTQSTKVDIDDPVYYNSNLVCRGCLKRSGVMKNLVEWGLDVDFFAYTDVPRDPSEGMPELICDGCEANLQSAKNFKIKCQQSDIILRSNMKKKTPSRNTVSQAHVTSVLRNKMLLYLITAPNPEDKIPLKCPHKFCNSEFYKKIHVITHLRKAHNISAEFEIHQQFYCTEKNCVYNLTSEPSKFFTGRKFLNQHYSKMHNDKVYSCESCHKKFPKVTDYYRHLKSCNLMYVCSSCNSSYTSHESYLVHLLRRHPDLHAKYKEEKKAKKRLTEKSDEDTDVNNVQLPTKIRKDNLVEKTKEKMTEEIKPNKLVESSFLQQTESNITRFTPLELNIDVFETSIPPLQYIAEIDSEETPFVAQEYTIQENICGESIAESFAENLTVAEAYTIKEKTDDKVIPENEKRNSNQIGEESLDRHISKRSDGVDVNNEMESLKKSSATQIPEDITNDVSLSAWSNKNDFELQNESTQTVFEDMLSMRSQNSDEEIYFSESVSLSDIQTQTAPFEFGLIRCNKETQSCTSQTQSPDLSIKETQTCFCLFDSPNFNFGHFVDSLPSNSASGNFISTETQTSDFRTAIRSDVLLSFSSAETQTCFEEATNSSM
ncbi:unnamed protein product [Arctia plantaginis]|uniref:ZAD domain-containing protein n=1 Tax=Arctia plantaginis TaxID=874455 RepID=A0A8S1A636_ARCPL|nr:unnamed protein product [Arctia plantaginis]